MSPDPSSPCLAPWKALSVRADGRVHADCQFSESYGSLQDSDLRQLWQSPVARDLRTATAEGKFHLGCGNCKAKEQSLGHSRRVFFDHILGRSSADAWLNLNSNLDLRHLEISLSNLCNLSCRMCNSVSSSNWISQDNILSRHKELDRPQSGKLFSLTDESVNRLFAEPELFKNLSHLSFRGGEPMMDARLVQILERFIELKLARQMTVDISTNGTLMPGNFSALAQEFKKVDLYVSVEAVGELYRYIRGGDRFSIDHLESRLKWFREIPNCNLIFAVTVSVYNILRLSEVWRWFNEIRGATDELNMTNIVVRPNYLNFQILPENLRLIAIRDLENSEIPKGDAGRSLLLNALRKEYFDPITQRTLIAKFLKFNDEVDQLRQTRLLDVLPELSFLYDLK